MSLVQAVQPLIQLGGILGPRAPRIVAAPRTARSGYISDRVEITLGQIAQDCGHSRVLIAAGN